MENDWTHLFLEILFYKNKSRLFFFFFVCLQMNMSMNKTEEIPKDANEHCPVSE